MPDQTSRLKPLAEVFKGDREVSYNIWQVMGGSFVVAGVSLAIVLVSPDANLWRFAAGWPIIGMLCLLIGWKKDSGGILGRFGHGRDDSPRTVKITDEDGNTRVIKAPVQNVERRDDDE